MGVVRCLECKEETNKEREKRYRASEFDYILDGGVNIETFTRHLHEIAEEIYDREPGERLPECGTSAECARLWAAEHDHVKPDHHILVYFEDKSHPLTVRDLKELGWFGGR